MPFSNPRTPPACRRFQLVAIDPRQGEYVLKPDISEQEALAYFCCYDPTNPVRVEAREVEPILKPGGAVLRQDRGGLRVVGKSLASLS